MSTYSQALRAIGQALDERHLEDFDLELHDGGFLVRGKVGNQSKRAGGVQVVLQLWKRNSNDFLELHFTPEDVEQLDQKGKLKRRFAAGATDFYSLPQLLRTLGAYVDTKGARLLGVYRRGSQLTIEYERTKGNRTSEEHTIPSFYDFFVKMYMRRSSRYRSK